MHQHTPYFSYRTRRIRISCISPQRTDASFHFDQIEAVRIVNRKYLLYFNDYVETLVD